MTTRIEVTPENAAELRQYATQGKEDHDSKPAFSGISVNANGGGGRTTYTQDETRTERFGPQRIQTADFNQEGSGVLASARSEGLSRLKGTINDRSIVTIDGSETSVAAAVAMGVLERTQDGGYREASSPKR